MKRDSANDGQGPRPDGRTGRALDSAPLLPVGVRPVTYRVVGAGPDREIEGAVVEEALACISVNGEEVATFMCTPRQLEEMALGFLFNEGLIEQLSEVRALHISRGKSCVDVWLHDSRVTLPRRKIVTAGCGGGVTFDDLSEQHEPLHSELRATPAQLADLMRQMHLGAELYQEARGIHTAALAGGDRLLLQTEDVGRHNCLDKVAGAAMRTGVETRDRILISSGRISSEMLNKARRMQVPIVCSRTSPTSLSVALADAWNMTIVAYLRQDRMRVYTNDWRVESGERG